MATEIEKTPTADVSANAPESGTYGEGAELARLNEQLPPMNRPGMGAATGGPAPMPQPDVQVPGRPGGRPLQAPAGVPDVIFQGGGPAPAGDPMAAPAPPDPQAARLILLQQLAESPEVSEETREWARLVLEALIGP